MPQSVEGGRCSTWLISPYSVSCNCRTTLSKLLFAFDTAPLALTLILAITVTSCVFTVLRTPVPRVRTALHMDYRLRTAPVLVNVLSPVPLGTHLPPSTRILICWSLLASLPFVQVHSQGASHLTLVSTVSVFFYVPFRLIIESVLFREKQVELCWYILFNCGSSYYIKNVVCFLYYGGQSVVNAIINDLILAISNILQLS